MALQQYKSFWQDSTLDLCQAGRRRSFARQGLSDEASRSLVLVGVCGDDSALWGYGRKPPLTHILPHYHVTWRTPAAPPLGDAFDLDLELEQRCFAALLRSDVSAPLRRLPRDGCCSLLLREDRARLRAAPAPLHLRAAVRARAAHARPGVYSLRRPGGSRHAGPALAALPVDGCCSAAP